VTTLGLPQPGPGLRGPEWPGQQVD